MSKMQTRRRTQIMIARMEIVAQMYLRQNSVRKIRDEVMKRLNLKTYSTKTVHEDIQRCLREWREDRIENMDDAITIELQRIDDICRELWEQWEKSKEDYIRTNKERKGVPRMGDADGRMQTTNIKTTESNIVGLGNVAYISEIRAQCQERRRLLGLYSAEKKEISGEVSFANLLMESGMLDEAERNSVEFDT